MSHLKTVSYLSLALCSLALTAYRKHKPQRSTAAEHTARQQVQSIAMSFQKSALNLLVARNDKLTCSSGFN